MDAGSPFSVPVSDTVDSTKVKCQGPGLGTNVRANIPQAFTVDASKAGVAPLQVRVQGPKGLCERCWSIGGSLVELFDWLVALLVGNVGHLFCNAIISIIYLPNMIKKASHFYIW